MRIPLDRKVLLALFLPFAVLACDDGGTGGSGGKGGSGATGGGGAGGTGGGTGGDQTTSTSETTEECKGPGHAGNDPDVDVGVVSASILDQDGNPASQIAVQVCGIDICLYGTGSDTGQVTVNANQTLKKPAFKYGDGVQWGRLAVLVPQGDSTYTDIVTVKLPPVGQGELFAPGKSVTSGGVTIDVPSGGEVEVDFLIYPEEVDQVFRAAEFPMDKNLLVDESVGLVAIFGVAPLETHFCPAAKVHVPNTPQLAPGTDVEFLIQGYELSQEWAAYGEWTVVSDGKVSADGSEIVTADGQGLPLLSTFGVRPKM